MEYFIILLSVPFLIGILSKIFLHHSISWKEFFIQLGVTVVLCGFLYSLPYMSKMYFDTADKEIYNGQIVNKNVKTDSYLRSYSCNCHSVCSGVGTHRSCTTRCQTCYEKRYTKKWWANTTIGSITFDSLDSTFRSVWETPDPAAYTNCKENEPASIEYGFTNYIKAFPESLFNNKIETETPITLEYPKVFSFYKINRVLNPEALPIVDTKTLNTLLNESLKTLSAQKQVNIIVILTEQDSSYRYAVENAWLSGKKNDVIVFLGMDNDRIVWTDVMTYAMNMGNEELQTKLRDELLLIGEYNPEKINKSIVNNVSMLYNRPHTEDFEYLKKDFVPALWVMAILMIISIGASITLTILFHRNEI